MTAETQTRKLIWTEQELPQGSPEWLEWRNSNFSLGGSDVAALMFADYNGHSPQMLWKKLNGHYPPVDYVAHMQRGNRLEQMARETYSNCFDVDVRPLCSVHPEHDLMRTSLDGLTTDNRVVTEIKCPKSQENHIRQTKSGKIPTYRYPQIQWQLAVMMAHYESVEHCDYISFWVDETLDETSGQWIVNSTEMRVIKVRPALDYIKELMRRAEIFIGYMKRGEEPDSMLFLDEELTQVPVRPDALPSNELETQVLSNELELQVA